MEGALRQLASEIDKGTVGRQVGLAEIAAVGDSELEPVIQGLFLQALVSESILVVRLEAAAETRLQDDKGKFSVKSLLGPAGLDHLRNTKGIQFLAISQVREKDKKTILAVQCVDLKTGKQTSKREIPLPDKADAEMLRRVELLPPRNVKILVHAATHLGKQVGRGECWDVPAEPLQRDGFTVQGYDFGTKVSWADALPGDVITIDNGKDYHVMVLLEPAKQIKQSRILHQNWNKQRFVVTDRLPGSYPVQDLIIWRPGVRQ